MMAYSFISINKDHKFTVNLYIDQPDLDQLQIFCSITTTTIITP